MPLRWVALSWAVLGWMWLAPGVRAQFPQDGAFAPPQATIDVPGFDPYSDPFVPQDPSLLPQSDPFANPGDLGDPALQQGPAFGQTRFFQQLSFEYTMLPRNFSGTPADGLGLDEAEINGTFAWPTLAGSAPLLFTPGFAVQWWDGPDVRDFPPQTYSAYLDVAWSPQFTPTFGMSLAVRPGIYSDFKELNSDSIRIKASALGIFTLSPQWQIAAGIVYLDRSRVKLLPAGGVVWTPSPDVRWELIFPQPKLAQRLTNVGNSSLWWYVGGEYGGDTWTMRVDGTRNYVDYNDIRVYLGLEWKPEGVRGIGGHIEFGYVFDRELRYLDGEVGLDQTLMLRAGLVY